MLKMECQAEVLVQSENIKVKCGSTDINLTGIIRTEEITPKIVNNILGDPIVCK